MRNKITAGPGALMGDTQAFVGWLKENDPENEQLAQEFEGAGSWGDLLKQMLDAYGDSNYVVQLINQYEDSAGINPAAAAKKKAKHSTLVSVATKLLAKGWDEKRIKAHLLKKAESIGNVVYKVVRDDETQITISFTVADYFRAGLTPDDIDERVQAFASQLDSDFYDTFKDLM